MWATHQSNGVPLSSQYLGGLEYQAFTTTRNFSGSQSTVAESGLEQSKIGLRVSETHCGRLCASSPARTTSDSTRCQVNSWMPAVPSPLTAANHRGSKPPTPTAVAAARHSTASSGAGASHPLYGSLIIGRQNSLELHSLAQYDPQALSYAFSFLGYSGFNGGAGSTEGARWDNSIRYTYQNGPAHVAVMYSNGGQDTGVLGKAYGANIGAALGGWSVDAVVEHENGAVNLRSAFDDVINPLPSPGLAAYISDDTSYNFMGKYTFPLGEAARMAKLTVYAGYSHIQKAHADYSVGTAQNNYPLSVGININSSAEYSMEWLGAKYALPSGWSFTGALYHISQNNWSIGLGTAGNDNIGCSGAGLLCSGVFNEGSLVADYAINKHYDAYVGVNYSDVTDGLANGFKGTPTSGTSGSENQTTIMIGFRIRI